VSIGPSFVTFNEPRDAERRRQGRWLNAHRTGDDRHPPPSISDQFLLADDRLHITDFEEARIGDPARDIGAFAGEWLFLAATGIPAEPAVVAGDDQLAVRAAAYARWHMLDRMIAASENVARLSPVNKAAAGIGRTLLLSPADFIGSLGLEA
jgi:aminoglycoside phosphotransferase (APT) family kinase protein